MNQTTERHITSARDELLMLDGSDEWPAKVDAILARHRAEVLGEAVDAARDEYLTDNTGDPEDEAYNRGVSDAVAAVGALGEAAE
ncbi:hypothetical protein [Streptomyces sp. NPDC002913]